MLSGMVYFFSGNKVTAPPSPKVPVRLWLQLKNRFSRLVIEDDSDENRQEDEGEVARENEVEKKWKKIKHTYCETAEDVLGYRTRKKKSWISPECWKGIEERKRLKQKLAGTRSERLKARLQQEYRKKDLEVKKSLRKDKSGLTI